MEEQKNEIKELQDEKEKLNIKLKVGKEKYSVLYKEDFMKITEW